MKKKYLVLLLNLFLLSSPVVVYANEHELILDQPSQDQGNNVSSGEVNIGDNQIKIDQEWTDILPSTEATSPETPEGEIPDTLPSDTSEGSMPEPPNDILPNNPSEEKKVLDLTLDLDVEEGQGTTLNAVFTISEDEANAIEEALVFYSTDGEIFEPLIDHSEEQVDLTYDCAFTEQVWKSFVISSREQPLQDFLKGTYSTLWFQVQITGSIYEGKSTVAKLERNLVQDIPDHYAAVLKYPRELENENGLENYKGVYSASINQGNEVDDILMGLPDKIPMNVQIFNQVESSYFASENVEYGVVWEIPGDIQNWDSGTYEIEGNRLIKPKDTSIIRRGVDTYEYTLPDDYPPLILELTIEKSGLPPMLLPKPPIEEDESLDDGSGGNRGNAGSSSNQEDDEDEEIIKDKDSELQEETKEPEEKTESIVEIIGEPIRELIREPIKESIRELISEPLHEDTKQVDVPHQNANYEIHYPELIQDEVIQSNGVVHEEEVGTDQTYLSIEELRENTVSQVNKKAEGNRNIPLRNDSTYPIMKGISITAGATLAGVVVFPHFNMKYKKFPKFKK